MGGGSRPRLVLVVGPCCTVGPWLAVTVGGGPLGAVGAAADAVWVPCLSLRTLVRTGAAVGAGAGAGAGASPSCCWVAGSVLMIATLATLGWRNSPLLLRVPPGSRWFISMPSAIRRPSGSLCLLTNFIVKGVLVSPPMCMHTMFEEGRCWVPLRTCCSQFHLCRWAPPGCAPPGPQGGCPGSWVPGVGPGSLLLWLEWGLLGRLHTGAGTQQRWLCRSLDLLWIRGDRWEQHRGFWGTDLSSGVWTVVKVLLSQPLWSWYPSPSCPWTQLLGAALQAWTLVWGDKQGCCISPPPGPGGTLPCLVLSSLLSVQIIWTVDRSDSTQGPLLDLLEAPESTLDDVGSKMCWITRSVHPSTEAWQMCCLGGPRAGHRDIETVYGLPPGYVQSPLSCVGVPSSHILWIEGTLASWSIRTTWFHLLHPTFEVETWHFSVLLGLTESPQSFWCVD